MVILRALWTWWKRTAHVIGNFQARIILNVFYFVVCAPFALGMKLLSDPLRIKVRGVAAWLPRRSSEDEALVVARRQF